MGGRARASTGTGARAWPLLLLLLALLVRGVTPPGWMPNPQGSASSPFVICTADGAHVVSLDSAGHPANRGHGERYDLCAFAGHHAGPAAEMQLALGAAQAEGFAPAQPAPAAAAARAQRHRDQAQRAPPTLV